MVSFFQRFRTTTYFLFYFLCIDNLYIKHKKLAGYIQPSAVRHTPMYVFIFIQSIHGHVKQS